MKNLILLFVLFVWSGLVHLNAQTVLFDQDFHAGIPASWSNTGTSNGIPNQYAVWKYTHHGSAGAYGNPASYIYSPTRANGFIIFDSDSLDNGGVAGAFGAGPAPAPQTVALTTSAIDITGNSYCVLNFYQFYRNYESTTVIGISTDSINWTLDTINTAISVNQETDSISQIRIDLSPVTNAGGPHNKVYISFIMDAYYYFWMIDDITVTTLPNNDLAINSSNAYTGTSALDLFYADIPISQAGSFNVMTQYANIGRDIQYDCMDGFGLIRNGVQTASHEAPALPALAYGADTSGSAVFYSQGIAQYIVACHVNSDSVDANPANNADSIYFAVTDSVYSINTTTALSNAYFLLETNEGYSYMDGTLFEVISPDTVTSITTAVVGGTAGTHPGAVIQASVFPASYVSSSLQYNPTAVVSTFTKTLASSDISSPTLGAPIIPITLPINKASGNAGLAPGLYWVAIIPVSTPDSNILIATTNYQPSGLPLLENSGQLYLMSNTDAAYCNMNFGLSGSSTLQASFTRSPSYSPVIIDTTVTFTGSTNGGPSSTYAWEVTGAASGIMQSYSGISFTDTFPVVDSFYVCLTVRDGNDIATSCQSVNTFSNTTGISDPADNAIISIYPNPTGGTFNIKVPNELIGTVYSLTDMAGREIFSGVLKQQISVIPASVLSSGAYIVHIGSGVGRAYKLIKE